MGWLAGAQVAAAALLGAGAGFAVPGAVSVTRPLWRRISRISAIAGLLLAIAAAALAWTALGRPPAARSAEWLVLVAPALALGYLCIEAFAKSREGGLAVLLAAAAVEAASIPAVNAPPDWPPRVDGPAGPWLGPYVVLTALAYGLLFAASLQAATFLVLERFRGAPVERVGRAVYWSACLGFPFLLAGMMAAAVWAQSVRGSYWEWTARESWTLVYCLALLAYLNLRFAGEWPERAAMWLLALALVVGLAAFAHAREMPAPTRDATMLVEPRGQLPERRSMPGAPSPRPRGPKPPSFVE